MLIIYHRRQVQEAIITRVEVAGEIVAVEEEVPPVVAVVISVPRIPTGQTRRLTVALCFWR